MGVGGPKPTASIGWPPSSTARSPAGCRPARTLEDAALTVTAQAVAAAALARTETRGCHHRSDFLDTDPAQAVSFDVRAGADGRIAVTEPVTQ